MWPNTAIISWAVHPASARRRPGPCEGRAADIPSGSPATVIASRIHWLKPSTVNGLPYCGIDNGHMVAVGDGENGEQVSVQRNRKLCPVFCCKPEWYPRSRRPTSCGAHRPALAGIKHKRNARRCLVPVGHRCSKVFDLNIRPGADFLGFRPFDAYRRIVVKPSKVDRMPDQDA